MLVARTQRRIPAPSRAVWAALCDGWTYSSWVVGTIRIRRVDADWPAVGSRLDHTVGMWPIMLQDHTQVLENDPGRRLVLQARGWPAGEARVELDLSDEGGETTVSMQEDPTSGPGAWISNPLVDRIGKLRLDETLHRLALLVEGRQQQPVS